MTNGMTLGEQHQASIVVAVLSSVVLTLLVMLLLFPNLWYGLHDISDIPVYHSYAQRMAAGERPFAGDFQI